MTFLRFFREIHITLNQRLEPGCATRLRGPLKSAFPTPSRSERLNLHNPLPPAPDCPREFGGIPARQSQAPRVIQFILSTASRTSRALVSWNKLQPSIRAMQAPSTWSNSRKLGKISTP